MAEASAVRMKRHLALLPLLALALCLPPGRPAGAAVMGDGGCEGLGVHAAWLDWGTGIVSVAVFNHTGDGRWPPRTLSFRVAYRAPGPAIESEARALPPLQPVNVALFDYNRVIGKDYSRFDGQRLLDSGRVRLVECIVLPPQR